MINNLVGGFTTLRFSDGNILIAYFLSITQKVIYATYTTSTSIIGPLTELLLNIPRSNINKLSCAISDANTFQITCELYGFDEFINEISGTVNFGTKTIEALKYAQYLRYGDYTLSSVLSYGDYFGYVGESFSTQDRRIFVYKRLSKTGKKEVFYSLDISKYYIGNTLNDFASYFYPKTVNGEMVVKLAVQTILSQGLARSYQVFPDFSLSILSLPSASATSGAASLTTFPPSSVGLPLSSILLQSSSPPAVPSLPSTSDSGVSSVWSLSWVLSEMLAFLSSLLYVYIALICCFCLASGLVCVYCVRRERFKNNYIP